MSFQPAALQSFSHAVRSIFPETLTAFKEGFTKGIPDGIREVRQMVVHNFFDSKLLGRRFLLNGLSTAGASYILSTNKTLAGDDHLETKDALKRAGLMGSINFIGSMFLHPPKPGFRNWARQDLFYGMILPVADIIGTLSQKYLLENNENKDSAARQVVCHAAVWGSTGYFIWYFYKAFMDGADTTVSRRRIGLYATILGGAIALQSYFIAKKQSEHSGNPHLDIGRFAALQGGSVVGAIIPISLISSVKVKSSTALFAADTMAGNMSVTLRSLPFRGGGMTHFYSKLQDYNWLHAQIMNGVRILALGLLLPTNQLYIHALRRKIGWLFFAAELADTFFTGFYWNLLDQTTGGRVLAGKGQWKKGEVPGFLKEARERPAAENCQKLHDQMINDMGSHHPIYRQKMPDQVDFVHHETFLPNSRFTSLEDWFQEMPEATLAIYGGGLLACKPHLEEKSKNGPERYRELEHLLRTSYDVIERRDPN